MPNWVRNNVVIEGPDEEIDRLLASCKTEESKFDFNGLVPMPDNVYQGNLGREEMEKYPGELNWYDWSCKHWGAKWNASNVSVSNFKGQAFIEFETPWSAPFPIFEAMRKQYPDLNIRVEYADEDLGYNCGIWKNGELYECAEGDREFARNVWGYEEDDFGEE